MPNRAGAFSESTGTFYNIRFPLKYKRDHHISQLEAINAVLAVKTLLPPDVSGVDVLVVTDNISSMYALNSGRTGTLYWQLAPANLLS